MLRKLCQAALIVAAAYPVSIAIDAAMHASPWVTVGASLALVMLGAVGVRMAWLAVAAMLGCGARTPLDVDEPQADDAGRVEPEAGTPDEAGPTACPPPPAGEPSAHGCLVGAALFCCPALRPGEIITYNVDGDAGRGGCLARDTGGASYLAPDCADGAACVVTLADGASAAGVCVP